MSSEDSSHEVVQKLTTVLIGVAAVISMLSALIALTETPELAYNGGVLAFLLAMMSATMILYTAHFRREYGA